MRICITGANSFIGLSLIKRASLLGWEVIAVVRPGSGKNIISNFYINTRVIELDLEDYRKLGELAGPVDCAVMLAWNGTRGQARLDYSLQKSNCVNNISAVRSLISEGCNRIITAGSQAEYGVYYDEITEETECKPITAYGCFKLSFYEEARLLCHRKGISLVEPRIFSLYGPGDYGNSLIMSSLRNMLENAPCRFTKAEQMWDYLYIDDAVDAIIGLCKKSGANGVYNLGSGDRRPLNEYIQELKLILHSNSELLFGAIPYSPEGIVNIVPSIEKIKHEIEWKPRFSFEQGIKRTCEELTGRFST